MSTVLDRIAAPAPTTPAAPSGKVAVITVTTELAEAAATGTALRAEFMPNLIAVIDGERTGLYARRERQQYDPTTGDSDTIIVEELIVPWVAWVSTVVQNVTIQDGNFVKQDDPKFEVTIATPDGRVLLVKDLRATDAYTPTKLLDKAFAGLPEPDVMASTAVKNMLRTLGHAQRQTRLVTTKGGWADYEGRATFIEPLGSVDASGIHTEITFPITSTDRMAGATSTDLPANVGDIISAWFRLTPDRPDIALAMLALVAASCLRLDRRTGVWLIAPPKTGKSLFIGAWHAWFSKANRGGAFSLILAGKQSTPGGIGTRLARIGGIVTADDLRVTDGNAFQKAETIGQAVYASLDESKLNPDGGDRESKYGATQACVGLTTESLPTGNAMEAIASRVVTVELQPGDFDRTAGGAYDQWKPLMPGANAIRGAFLRWLAAKADSLGGLEQFTQWTTSYVQEEFMNLADEDGTVSREAEVVSVLKGGWNLLTEFLAENGYDLEAPEGAWETLLGESGRRSREANPVVGVLNWIRENIGRKGHFVAAANEDQTPKNGAHLLGWKDTAVGKQGVGEQWGLINEEQGLVFIPMGVLTDASARWDNTTRPLVASQVRNGLGAIPEVLSGSAERVPMEYARAFGWDERSRKRGAVVSVDWLLNG
ncbi:hypothetical protein [Microbacterium sp. Leaf203]|uniref:hypothetical protein n=1 Tax=Microbacterium sp. Leaf203 TaxID=1735677 RepID=UPI000ABE5AD8|nr:hypothetical protein [Microbacterium sp. Leaf203]